MSSPTVDDELRHLLSEAYARRPTTKVDPDSVDFLLQQAEDLAQDDAGWRLRLLVERSRHRAYREGRSDSQAVGYARAALDSRNPAVDPLLRALVTWEASRFDLVPDGAVADVEKLADELEAAMPAPDRWGVPATDVLGYLRLLVTDMYRRQGAFDERLRSLRAIIDSPYCAHREVGKAYRMSITMLRNHFDVEGARLLVAEFEARERELDGDGRAHFARMMSSQAQIQNRWRESIAHLEKSYDLALNSIAKGNIANGIAYCYCRLRDAEAILRWTDRAEKSWSELGTARVGRLISLRYRAVAASIQGDWVTAFQRCAKALESTTGAGIVTWTTLVEVIADAARAGVDPAQLGGLGLPTGQGTSIDGADLEAFVAHLLGLESADGWRVSQSRIAVALTVLVVEGWTEPPPGLRERLVDVLDWLVERHRWWRAGTCAMALADLERVAGDPHAAAVRTEQGFDLWSRHQGRAAGEDHPWLVMHERRRFLEGWSTASAIDDHRLAAKIAEAARGTALAAMLSDPSLEGTAIAEELERRIGAKRIVQGPEDGFGVASEQDESEGRPTPNERAAMVIRGQAVLATLDTEAQTLWRMVERDGSDDLARPAHGWTIWIDIQDDNLYLAALGPSNASWSSTQALPERVAKHVRGLADPLAAHAKVRAPLTDGLIAALEVLGRALEGGPLGQDLAAATVDAPLELRISPGGLAWAVPWPAVRVWGDALVGRAVITLVSSEAVASVLDGLDSGAVEDPVVVFDPSLPGTNIEQAALAECWGRVRNLDLSGDRPVGGGGMFVASVHGDYAQGGLRQCLLLPGRRVEGVELFTWTFPRLTVLGACWVGRVDATSSGEALGLVFPVLARGARTVIGGMFAIHDEETGRILADLYRSVAAGEGAASALRVAQLQALDRCGPRGPLARWAGLCAVGVH